MSGNCVATMSVDERMHTNEGSCFAWLNSSGTNVDQVGQMSCRLKSRYASVER